MFLVIGSTTLDLIHSGFDSMPTAQGDEFTTNSLVFCADPVQMRFGGNGANSAYTLAKLGGIVALGSAIGRDAAGDLLYAPLVDVGVNLAGLIRHPTAATSVTTVITDAASQRLAFHHAGSSHLYDPTDLSDALRAQTSVLLIASFTLFLRWRPHGFADLLRAVKERGGITALDIGPAVGEPALFDEIISLLPYVDYFICNEHELAVCVGVAQSPAALHLGMKQILAGGANTVVLKRGAAGALVQSQTAGSPTHVAGFPVDVESTVGAGDTFNAGFLYAVAQGQDPIDAARFASGVAALVIASTGGVLRAPTLPAVEAFLSTQG